MKEFQKVEKGDTGLILGYASYWWGQGKFLCIRQDMIPIILIRLCVVVFLRWSCTAMEFYNMPQRKRS